MSEGSIAACHHSRMLEFLIQTLLCHLLQHLPGFGNNDDDDDVDDDDEGHLYVGNGAVLCLPWRS